MKRKLSSGAQCSPALIPDARLSLLLARSGTPIDLAPLSGAGQIRRQNEEALGAWKSNKKVGQDKQVKLFSPSGLQSPLRPAGCGGDLLRAKSEKINSPSGRRTSSSCSIYLLKRRRRPCINFHTAKRAVKLYEVLLSRSSGSPASRWERERERERESERANQRALITK